MLLQGCAAEAPQDQAMILVVYGVTDGNILDQIAVFPNDVTHLVLYLSTAV